jgi:hemolysin III
MSIFAPRTGYSRAEVVSDVVIHVSGVVLALGSVPVLVAVAAFERGDRAAVLATAVYGAGLLAMLLASALYNVVGRGEWAWLLQRLDHAMIFAKIAATYTAFLLLAGAPTPWFVGALWVAAFLGITLQILSPVRFRLPSIVLYLGMGWAGLFILNPLMASLSPPVVVLIAVGGGLYTLGVFFYLFDRLPFHYTIWHVLVLIASMTLYAAITLQVVQAA